MTRLALLGFSLFICGAHAGAAQQTATVRVQVLDSAASRPIVSAGVQATGWTGLAWTDSVGRFTMTGVPLTTELRIRCPTTRRLAGRVVRRQALVVRVLDTTVVIRLGESECIDPPIQSTVGEFRGHYTSGFESSDFRPCGGLPAAAKVFDDTWGAAWVRYSPQFDWRRVKWPKVADTTSYPMFYLRWHGTLTGPGSYGHLGLATYEFVVDSIVEIRLPSADDCR